MKKNVLNQTSKRLLWNLQQMGKMIRPCCWHQNLVPWGCLPLPRGYIHVLNHEKNCTKSDFKDIFFLNLQQMNEVTRHFSWNQNFVPGGLSAPAPGLYTCIKSWKKLYKIRLQRDFFLNLQQMTAKTRCSCWHLNFIPQGLTAPAPGLYTCIKSWFVL